MSIDLARSTAALMVVLILTGCGAAGVQTAEELNASYDAALARTAAAAVELPGGDEGPRATLAAIEQMLADPAPETVRARVRAVYAPDAYLNDNLAAVEGGDTIADYFVHAVGNVQAFGLEVLDLSHRGSDYFVRWRMTITSTRLHDGAPMISYGVTHFRFDASGRVLLHKDFWDAGTGLYEYIPGVRGLIRRVRAAALPEWFVAHYRFAKQGA